MSYLAPPPLLDLRCGDVPRVLSDAKLENRVFRVKLAFHLHKRRFLLAVTPVGAQRVRVLIFDFRRISALE
jgi:hypothetical protein